MVSTRDAGGGRFDGDAGRRAADEAAKRTALEAAKQAAEAAARTAAEAGKLQAEAFVAKRGGAARLTEAKELSFGAMPWEAPPVDDEY